MGEVAAIPCLVVRARDAARHPGDVGEGGEGGGSERRAGGHGDAPNRSSPKAKPLPFTGGAVRLARLPASRSGEGVRRYRTSPTPHADGRGGFSGGITPAPFTSMTYQSAARRSGKGWGSDS